jgi:MFS family permease
LPRVGLLYFLVEAYLPLPLWSICVSTSPTAPRLSLTAWLIVIIAAIGFAFDTYELLMLPLIVRDAIMELTGFRPGTPEFSVWAGRLFYLPAVFGGIFGLVGGYLTDRLGRRRVLTGSILLYAFSAFLAGFSTNIWMLLVFRCTTFIGVCVEFVAAIAWLAELFPDPKQRERVIGYTQAFSSFGGLLVAIVFSLIAQNATRLPPISIPDFASSMGTIDAKNQHAAWRYMLMSGLIPAIPLILIRPFLPESPVWQRKREAGTLKRPSIRELFAPAFCRTTIVTTLMFACSYGVAFGAIQQIPQIVPGLAEVKAQTEGKPPPVKADIERKAAADFTKLQEIGGLLGRFALAFLAVRIVSRRALLWIFQVPSLLVVPAVFYLFLHVEDRHFFDIPIGLPGMEAIHVTTVMLGVALAGFFTVAQFSFWGNYLPRVYPVHLRGTGESFAANIGGRMIGTGFAAVTSYLAVQPFIPGDSAPEKYAVTAAAVALGVISVGFLTSFFLPEPPHDLED